MSEPSIDLRVGGRPARVAVLVYNDAHADTRVLKTAATLAAAGARVRIFAVARARSGFPVGTQRLDSGVELQRLPEFELARSAPWLASAYRWVRRRVAAVGSPAGAASEPVRPTADPGSAGTAPSAGAGSEPAAPTAVGGSAGADLPGGPAAGATSGGSVRARAVSGLFDLWLRTYRTVSLAVYWAGAVRAASHWCPDLVHANDGNTLAPALAVRSRTGARIVYDAHELWRHRNVRSRPLAPHVEHLIERCGIRRAAGVITVSPNIARWLQRTYGLLTPPTLVRNIPPAATAPISTGTGRLRQLAGLTPAAKVIAYGGRLTTNRGIEETVGALAHMASDVHLVLLGYGEPNYVEPLRARVGAAGLNERVHFVGRVDSADVAATLADADLSVVYVRPSCLSYYYSLPNKLFESIHAGLPIAAADLPDTREIVLRYGVGRVFATEDGRDLAATMTEVLADPESYRAAARAAAAELTWEREAGRLLELYRQILSRVR